MRAMLRMVQGGEDFRFALEPGEPIGIVRDGIWQDLQRDVAIQFVSRAR